MILREFFSKPIDISANQKTRDLKKSVKSDELFWFIIDSDKLYKKHFFPISKQLNKNKNCDESKIIELFMPMVKDGCKDYYSKNKLSGKLETVFPKNLRDEICHKLHDHYRDGLSKNEYKLNEYVLKNTSLLNEGGNAQVADRDNPKIIYSAEKIDLEKINRTQAANAVKETIAALNQGFQAMYKEPIFGEELFNSNEYVSGSSKHFFNTAGITDKDFVKYKKKVGDIDIQCDVDQKPKIQKFLDDNYKQQFGPGRLLGYSSAAEQFNSIFRIDELGLNVQIDFEFGEYDKEIGHPTEWYKFSHSSEWNDITANIKGVFHKWIYRALPAAKVTPKHMAVYKGSGKNRTVNIDPEPTQSKDISFAVGSSQGGGAREKFAPYLDPNTGEPMQIKGVPVKQEVPSGQATYVQNLDKQFEMFFGVQPSGNDKTLQKSYLGTLELMNKYLDQTQIVDAFNEFINICFSETAQMIDRDNPESDAEAKFAAIDKGLEILKISNKKQLRDQAVSMAKVYSDEYFDLQEFKKWFDSLPLEKQKEINPRKDVQYNALRKKLKAAGQWPINVLKEDENPAVVASARKGVTHLEKMKDLDFLDLLDQIKDESGSFKLNNIKMTVKIDGLGGRFGKDANSVPFFETSSSGPIQRQGAFSAFAKERGFTNPDQIERAAHYDQLYDQIMQVIPAIDKTYGKHFLKDVKVHCEVLYIPMAKELDDKLKFVSVAYNKFPQGITLALVPLFIEKASSGEDHPDNDKIKKLLIDLGTVGNTVFIDNAVTYNGTLDVTGVLPPLENLDELRSMLLSKNREQIKSAKEAILPIKNSLANTIIKNPNILGKDKLGQDYEGLILYTDKGPIKITSPYFKDLMAQKQAEKAQQIKNTPITKGKKAVVTIGNFVGHKGHQELIQTVLDVAKQENRTPFIYIGQAYGPNDPISPEDRKKTLDTIFPEYRNQIQLVDEGNFAKKIEIELSRNFVNAGDEPYKDIMVVVGSDRASDKNFTDLLKRIEKRLNNPEYPASNGTNIQIVDRATLGSVNETVRGTDLRNILKSDKSYNEKLQFWISSYDPKLSKNWIEHLMTSAADKMGVPLQKDQPPPANKPQDKISERLLNALIRPTKMLSENLFNAKQPTLSQGDNGVEVKQLQWGLNSLGSNIGEIDGIFGKQTKAGVIDFQKKSNLAPDGIAGNKVFSSLNNALTQKGIKEFPPQLRTITKKPSPASDPSTAKTAAEKYLGREISDEEWDMLIRATSAESSPDQEEQGYIMGVILNRVRSGKWGNSIESVLTARNQFQAVTGTRVKPGPSPQYSAGPTPKRLNSLLSSAANVLPSVPKSYLYFTAANPAAYGKGTNIGFKDTLISRGGKQIGQTIFAA